MKFISFCFIFLVSVCWGQNLDSLLVEKLDSDGIYIFQNYLAEFSAPEIVSIEEYRELDENHRGGFEYGIAYSSLFLDRLNEFQHESHVNSHDSFVFRMNVLADAYRFNESDLRVGNYVLRQAIASVILRNLIHAVRSDLIAIEDAFDLIPFDEHALFNPYQAWTVYQKEYVFFQNSDVLKPLGTLENGVRELSVRISESSIDYPSELLPFETMLAHKNPGFALHAASYNLLMYAGLCYLDSIQAEGLQFPKDRAEFMESFSSVSSGKLAKLQLNFPTYLNKPYICKLLIRVPYPTTFLRIKSLDFDQLEHDF